MRSKSASRSGWGTPPGVFCFAADVPQGDCEVGGLRAGVGRVGSRGLGGGREMWLAVFVVIAVYDYTLWLCCDTAWFVAP